MLTLEFTMSDGPHRSLKMRPGWKRVARCADNDVFQVDEIRNAIIPALDEDFKGEVGEEFLSNLDRICSDRDESLFKSDMEPQLEQLREQAGSGLGSTVLDYANQLSKGGKAGQDTCLEAVKLALKDRAAGGGRHVEEHFLRKSTKRRAFKIRDRIEQGIKGAEIEGLARRILKRDGRKSSTRLQKRQGLDDGVKL